MQAGSRRQDPAAAGGRGALRPPGTSPTHTAIRYPNAADPGYNKLTSGQHGPEQPRPHQSDRSATHPGGRIRRGPAGLGAPTPSPRAHRNSTGHLLGLRLEQIARVVRTRHLGAAVVRALVIERIQGRTLGVGEPRVYVLELNLDATSGAATPGVEIDRSPCRPGSWWGRMRRDTRSRYLGAGIEGKRLADPAQADRQVVDQSGGTEKRSTPLRTTNHDRRPGTHRRRRRSGDSALPAPRLSETMSTSGGSMSLAPATVDEAENQP